MLSKDRESTEQMRDILLQGLNTRDSRARAGARSCVVFDAQAWRRRLKMDGPFRLSHCTSTFLTLTSSHHPFFSILTDQRALAGLLLFANIPLDNAFVE